LPRLRIITDDEWTRAHARLSTARASYIKATGGLVFGRPVNSFASPYLLTGLARCSVCGASFVVLTRDFKSERRPFYACSYHHHRGAVVCPNGLPAEMQATNREVLTSIGSRLSRRTVVEQAIEMALADLAPRRDARAAEQEALTARLRQLEAELERLTAAVAAGGELPTLLAALKEREGQRAECRRQLETLGHGVRPLDLKRVERQIRERLRDATRLLERQVGPARGVLRELLAVMIAFTPHIAAERRWYEFAGQLSLGGLLAGEVPQAMVTPAGFEPAISTLKGSRPGPG
jgi:hypothetical protein